MIWSPVIIYSTVGTLLLVITYDFLRYLIPSSNYKMLWLYEHIFKMIGAFTALLSAFSGTVFSKIPARHSGFCQIGIRDYFARRRSIIVLLQKKQDPKFQSFTCRWPPALIFPRIFLHRRPGCSQSRKSYNRCNRKIITHIGKAIFLCQRGGQVRRQ